MTRTGARRVTGADVAEAAGVSRTTVSYVLGGNPKQTIPESTRTRILEAAERLGYVPHGSARLLRTGQSRVVLLSMPDWPGEHSAASQIASGMSARLAEHGMTLVMHVVGSVRAQPTALLSEVLPAAVVSFTALSTDEIQVFHQAGVSVVLPPTEAPSPSFWIDWGPIGRVQAEHLIDRGRRRLGYASPPQSELQGVTRERSAGAQQVVERLGLPALDFRAIPSDPAGAVAAMAGWLAQVPDLDGICAYSDTVAMAVLHALRALGVEVPGRIAVVGADAQPVSALCTPPLTTVQSESGELGRQIADFVVRRLAAEREARQSPKGTELGPLLPEEGFVVSRPVRLLIRESS